MIAHATQMLARQDGFMPLMESSRISASRYE